MSSTIGQGIERSAALNSAASHNATGSETPSPGPSAAQAMDLSHPDGNVNLAHIEVRTAPNAFQWFVKTDDLSDWLDFEGAFALQPGQMPSSRAFQLRANMAKSMIVNTTGLPEQAAPPGFVTVKAPVASSQEFAGYLDKIAELIHTIEAIHPSESFMTAVVLKQEWALLPLISELTDEGLLRQPDDYSFINQANDYGIRAAHVVNPEIDTTVLYHLIYSGVDFISDSPNYAVLSPIASAFINRHYEFCFSLINMLKPISQNEPVKALANCMTASGKTLAAKAVERGDESVIKSLIRMKGAINTPDCLSCTPVIKAIMLKNSALTQLLLSRIPNHDPFLFHFLSAVYDLKLTKIYDFLCSTTKGGDLVQKVIRKKENAQHFVSALSENKNVAQINYIAMALEKHHQRKTPITQLLTSGNHGDLAVIAENSYDPKEFLEGLALWALQSDKVDVFQRVLSTPQSLQAVRSLCKPYFGDTPPKALLISQEGIAFFGQFMRQFKEPDARSSIIHFAAQQGNHRSITLIQKTHKHLLDSKCEQSGLRPIETAMQYRQLATIKTLARFIDLKVWNNSSSLVHSAIKFNLSSALSIVAPTCESLDALEHGLRPIELAYMMKHKACVKKLKQLGVKQFITQSR